MPSWKEKVAKYIEDEQRAKRLEEEERNEPEREEQARLLAEHQATIFCHICGIPSRGPAWCPSGDGGEFDTYHYDWSQSMDLIKCRICGKWVCRKDNYLKICSQCGRNL